MNLLVKWLVVFSIAFGLSSCADNPVKPDDSATSSKESAFEGHLTVQERPSQDSVSNVPNIVQARPFNPPPRAESKQAVYSLTAIDAPVHEIIYRLALMADHQVDIWQGIEGNLTINAVNQPLTAILKRIADQLDLIIHTQNGVIEVRPDIAYWKHYRIDYVNIKRSSRDSIVMNMTVGGSVNPVSGGQSTGSRSVVEVSSEHDFWSTLRLTLTSMTSEPGARSSSPTPATTDGASTNAAPTSVATTGVGSVVVNPEAGLALVHATHKRHNKVQKYLDSITQRSERQVMIEASVVEVVLSEEHQSGIDWSNPGIVNLSNRTVQPGENVFTATLGGNVGVDMSLGLKMLEKFGDVQVLSSPKIMAVNNQTALLKVVDNEVYFTIDVSRSTSTAGTDVTYSTTVHTVPVGFMMSMTPFVNDQREISINIRPTISRIIGNVKDPNPDLQAVGAESLIPIVQEREMETVLKLRDQQTAVIGGLIEDRHDNMETGVPWLSRIPILGKSLFGYTERKSTKTELVIFIRPVIVDRPDIEAGDLQQFRSLLRQRTGDAE